ncbi:TRAP transporter substrate-binding protein [Pseudacidovorax sp. RU35E]|uniref:TRAP transporter substrate-binding protein n=1 Tax=Pseudacidovorax sp. RU35E TaxID=1907403 RepID=UPI0009563D0B|nr:TRAP transporter substrate-binding protein [Pseudacidovorax sp. RU35E]SIQ51242.1 tripartite ATP-independent transporter solute receptor, DctP family [Pseudacidovorax sp. RU35E]
MKIRSLGLATVLLAALAGSAFAQVKEHVFKIGTGLSEDHPQAQALKYFADRLAAKSGGKLTARVYASGSLGNDLSMTSALRGGTLEMTIPDSSTLVSLVKPFGVLNLPMTFNNEKEADAVLDGTFGQKLLAKLPEKGLIGLGYWENGFRHVTNSRRPVQRADDLSGLKLRVIQSPLFLETFNALGANATPMPFTELYTAMEQAAVDGQENPPATILASKFYEVQKHLVLSRHMYSAWVLLMSKKTWDGLSAEEQKIVQDAAKEAMLYERKTIRAFSDTALADLKKAGMQITELPPAEQARMRSKLQPVLAKFSKEYGEDTTAEMNGELAKVRGSTTDSK